MVPDSSLSLSCVNTKIKEHLAYLSLDGGYTCLDTNNTGLIFIKQVGCKVPPKCNNSLRGYLNSPECFCVLVEVIGRRLVGGALYHVLASVPPFRSSFDVILRANLFFPSLPTTENCLEVKRFFFSPQDLFFPVWQVNRLFVFFLWLWFLVCLPSPTQLTSRLLVVAMSLSACLPHLQLWLNWRKRRGVSKCNRNFAHFIVSLLSVTACANWREN